VIDLWRLWNGLPDLRFRDAGGFDWNGDWGRDFGGFGQAPEDLDLILRIAARPQAKGLTPAFRYVAARYLNILVSAGSGPGWWLAPDHQDRNGLQDKVAAAARPGSFMEWLLVVMAESDRDWAVSWDKAWYWDGAERYRRHDGGRSDDLRSVVATRRAESAGLAWMVVADLMTRDGNGLSMTGAKVAGCTASDAEYAAYAVLLYREMAREGVETDPKSLPKTAALDAGMGHGASGDRGGARFAGRA